MELWVKALILGAYGIIGIGLVAAYLVHPMLAILLWFVYFFKVSWLSD